jgi:hypothetical protein
VNGRATTTISIYRGSTTDEYTDEIDVNDNTTLQASGVIASIVEQTRRAFVAAESRKTVVKNSIGRCTAGTDIIEGDRVMDERTLQFYFVEAISTPASPRGTPDLRMVLRAVKQ